MSFSELSGKIIKLSEEIEDSLANHKEDICSELLQERLMLLKTLADMYEDDINFKEQFYNFLRNIQRRDAEQITNLYEKKSDIASNLKSMMKNNKAVSAYKSIVIE